MSNNEFSCPKCPSEVNESQKFCPACGAALLWEKVPGQRPRKSNRKGSIFWNVGVLVVLICVIFGVLSRNNSDTTNVGNLSSHVPVTDNSWIPISFIQYNNSIAYSVPDKQDCSAEFSYCFQYDFITKSGCPSGFYAALNWKDKSGAVLDYTNATLPSLKPMQVAKLTFNFTLPMETSFGGLDIAEVRCY